jgi:hypothetical protein
MDKSEIQPVLGQDIEWADQLSCLNTACVSGLSIVCFVAILLVSLVCPFSVLSQCCLCLWFVHSVSCLNAAGSIEKRHKLDKPMIQAALRQDTKWTNLRHRQYWDKTQNGQTRDTGSIGTRPLVCPFSVLLQICLSLGLSILCLIPMLLVTLGCPLCVSSQCCLCLWFVHHMSCLNTTRVSGLSILSLVGQTRDSGSIGTRNIMGKPESQAALG